MVLSIFENSENMTLNNCINEEKGGDNVCRITLYNNLKLMYLF